MHMAAAGYKAEAAGGGPVRVVLVGHSYVRRLRDSMATSPELANLGLSDVKVLCERVGGATLGPHFVLQRINPVYDCQRHCHCRAAHFLSCQSAPVSRVCQGHK